MGDDLTFETLEIGFLVDAKLENYIELHNWLLGIGFPKSRTLLPIRAAANGSCSW